MGMGHGEGEANEAAMLENRKQAILDMVKRTRAEGAPDEETLIASIMENLKEFGDDYALRILNLADQATQDVGQKSMINELRQRVKNKPKHTGAMAGDQYMVQQ